MRTFLACSFLVMSVISMQSLAQLSRSDPSDKALTESTVNALEIGAHMRFLSSDELMGRDTPSPGLKTAARYIESELIRYGVRTAPGMDSYFQPVPLKVTTPPNSLELVINDRPSQSDQLVSINSSNIELMKEKMVFLEFGGADDFDKVDVSDKIVVVKCGDGVNFNAIKWFEMGIEKRQRALDGGALALVELYQRAPIPWQVVTGFLRRTRVAIQENAEANPTELAHLWVNDPEFELEELIKSTGKDQASLIVAASESSFVTSQNVVGMVEGTDLLMKDQFIVYSAHYDHVGIGKPNDEGDSIYNGARDNAFGTTNILSIAKNISLHPTKRSAIFLFFTAEEKGLLGSKWYVDHPVVPMENHVFCFNIDNAGYNNTEVATTIGLERTSAGNKIKEACRAFNLEAIADPAPEQGLFNRSDNVHFARKGIPAPTLSMGFTAFDETIMAYYHQPTDQFNTLDFDYLQKLISAYVYAARLIANSKNKPFWIEGDEYYEAGLELYGSK